MNIDIRKYIEADFQEDLAWSEQASCEPFWDAVYRKAFPNMVAHMPCGGDTFSQRQGIDRIIHLANGKTLYIDEKKRRKVYTDIALEYISSDATNAPGWIEKDLAIDYLAYAFMPISTCYLFPWPMLRRAWSQFSPQWKTKYQAIQAYNPGYTTWSLCVPIDILQRAVTTATVIDVSDEMEVSTPSWLHE